MTITGDYLFVTLVLMVLGLNLIQIRRPNILVAFSISMIWFSLALWLFFGSSPPLTLAQDWTGVLIWVFVMLAFVPWLFQMDTEITNEANGKRWKSWGRPPKEGINRRKEYQDTLRGRWRRR